MAAAATKTKPLSKTAAHRVKINTVSPATATARRDAASRAARNEQLRAYLAAGGRLWAPKKSNGLRFVDIFCGAGGSSIGLSAAGYELLLAANHWATAIDTHAANFTKAEHLCADVNNYDFRRLPRGADVLWASPICTEISPAGGNATGRSDDETEQLLGHVSLKGQARTRATFYDVLRAVEVWRFKAVMIENVPDVAEKWGLFGWWLKGMERLGYTYQLVSINSAHVGGDGIPYAPQWRDRLYIVFIRKDIGRTPDLDLRPQSRCFNCDTDVPGVQTWIPGMERREFKVGRYRRDPKSSYGQYWYTCPNSGCRQRVEPYVMPAAAAIDWSNLGVRICDMPKTALKPEGLAPKTMARIRKGMVKYGRQRLVGGHLRPGNVPDGAYYIKNFTDPDPGRMSKSIHEPLGTVTTVDHHGLVVPPQGAFRVNSNHIDDRIYSLDDYPLNAATTKQGDGIVIPPMLVPTGGQWADDPIDVTAAPARTVMANPKGCEALVTDGDYPPGSFLDVARNHYDGLPLGGPMATVSTARHNALVVPNAFNVSYYGKGDANSMAEPLGTVSTHDRFAMISPERLAEMTEEQVRNAFYRMLLDREALRAQAFPDNYIVLGGSGERTKQAGNAVSCNVAQFIGERVAAVLLPHPA